MALLRPVTADIWSQYPETERRRFLRHIQPYWEIHRHRLAPAVAARLQDLRETTLETRAARLIDLRTHGNQIAVTCRLRGENEVMEFNVAAVINCTGASTVLTSHENPLISNLLESGLMRPDSLRLGIDTGPDFTVIARDGSAVPGLYYIGPWLRALLLRSNAPKR